MIKKISYCGLLASLAIVISALEHLVPLTAYIPLPGIKLGLSNCILIYVLYKFGFAYSFSVMFVKCFVSSMLFSGLTSFVYAFTGGLFAVTVMYFISKSKHFSVYGVSVAGAAFHNFGQITAAAAMLGSTMIYKYLPVLLFISVFTGLLTGSIADIIFKKTKVYK